MQVQTFEEENEQLPAVVHISGTSIFLPRLVAFTGTRFLRSAAANACIKFGSEEETAQMQLLLSVLDGGEDTPASLSLEELSQLLCACHFALAETLLEGFTCYLSRSIFKLGIDDVRACLALCIAQLGIGCNADRARTGRACLAVCVAKLAAPPPAVAASPRLFCNAAHSRSMFSNPTRRRDCLASQPTARSMCSNPQTR